MDALAELIEDLQRSTESKQDESGNMFLRSMYQMGDKAAGLSPDASVCFQAMMVFCTVVPADMKRQVSLVLDECFADSDPQVYLNSEARHFKLSC